MSSADPTPSPEDKTSENMPPEEAPSFGWSTYAERINGRFAMVGFIALLLVELLTGEDFFTWLGLFR